MYFVRRGMDAYEGGRPPPVPVRDGSPLHLRVVTNRRHVRLRKRNARGVRNKRRARVSHEGGARGVLGTVRQRSFSFGAAVGFRRHFIAGR